MDRKSSAQVANPTSTDWEHELCTNQKQSSTCQRSSHLLLEITVIACSIDVSYKVVRALTQHMENLASRLRSNPQTPYPLSAPASRLFRVTEALLSLLVKTLAENNSMLIGPKQNWLHSILLKTLIYFLSSGHIVVEKKKQPGSRNWDPKFTLSQMNFITLSHRIKTLETLFSPEINVFPHERAFPQ